VHYTTVTVATSWSFI